MEINALSTVRLHRRCSFGDAPLVVKLLVRGGREASPPRHDGRLGAQQTVLQ